MTDKERLEEIKEMVDSMVFYKHLFKEDGDRFYWLLEYAKEQAERVQELEEEVERYQSGR